MWADPKRFKTVALEVERTPGRLDATCLRDVLDQLPARRPGSSRAAHGAAGARQCDDLSLGKGARCTGKRESAHTSPNSPNFCTHEGTPTPQTHTKPRIWVIVRVAHGHGFPKARYLFLCCSPPDWFNLEPGGQALRFASTFFPT